MSISGALADATCRTASAMLPALDFTRPVLDVLGKLPVHRLSASATAFRGVMALVKGRHDSLVTMDGEGMAGIITEADFLKLPLETGKVRRTLLRELMTPSDRLVSVSTASTAWECLTKMRESDIRHIPVFEDDGSLKTVIGLAEVSEQMLVTLSRRDGAERGITVGDFLSDGQLPVQATRSLAASASVDEALDMMRETSFHALLVHDGPSATASESAGFGIFTGKWNGGMDISLGPSQPALRVRRARLRAQRTAIPLVRRADPVRRAAQPGSEMGVR